MQNPPPGPPPGPAPQGQPMASSGIDKRTGALLSYLVTWITGLIFLFVGKNDPDVKFHAAQSIVTFGSLTVLEIVFNIIGAWVGFVTIIGSLLGLVQFVLWIFCLYKAWTGGGRRFAIPVIGSFITPYAEQLANSVT